MSMGPIFIAGRQHSGNTVLSVMFQRVPSCYAQIDENSTIEHLSSLDAMEGERRVRATHELLKIEAEGQAGPALEHLLRYAQANPGVDALGLYLEGMRFVTEAVGALFFVQKATSYVFYGRTILDRIPRSKLIYMSRNPYDIAASKKRRKIRREFVWNTMYSWNKGTRIAEQLTRESPERVRIVRYEDLVTEPERTVRSVCDFAGVDFDPSFLDVPHVNRSETGYSLQGEGRGLNRSRVFYYADNLSPSEIRAMDSLADAKLISALYPELPHWKEGRRGRTGNALASAWLRASGPPLYFLESMTARPTNARHMLARTWQRLRA